ncbi:hypothetical protein BHE74_00023028, partial [Ensete ventricosum]
SSFYPKDALTPLSPSTPSPLPLRRRRLPLPVGSHPAKGRPPCWRQGWPRAPCSRLPLRAPRCKRLPPLRAGRCRSCPRAALLPAGAAPMGCWPPFQTGPGHDLTVGGRSCMGAGRPSSSLPSLQKRSKNM